MAEKRTKPTVKQSRSSNSDTPTEDEQRETKSQPTFVGHDISQTSLELPSEKTQVSSVDPTIFDDARRALLPSGATQFSFTTTNGSLKAQSPHMVNVHQFYPEVDFTMDKGNVGEFVQIPKVSKNVNKGKALSEQDTIKKDLMSMTSGTPNITGDNASHTDVFTTEVSEDTLAAAQQRLDAKQTASGNIVAGVGTYQIRKLVQDESLFDKLPRKYKDFVYPKTVEHYQKAMAHMEEEEYLDAITSLNKAIQLMPLEVDFYIKRGNCFFYICDFSSAIVNFKHACVLDPDNLVIYNRLAFIYYFYGQCLFDQKLFPEALESFSRAAEMRPEVIGYHTRSIACLAALERHGECLALVNKRLEQETQNADLYILRARLHKLFRNTTLCYYDVKDALAIDPRQPEALSLLKYLQEKAQGFRAQAVNMTIFRRFRDAVERISLAIETDPSVAEFHVFRGAAHRQLQDYNAAIDDFLLGMDKTDHNEEDKVYYQAQRQLLLTYNDFAVECFTKGYYEEAIILLNKAIKTEKHEKGLYINRGDCFYRQGNMHFALSDYHQALEIDGQDKEILDRIAIVNNDLAVMAFTDKNYAEADNRFTVAIQHNPRCPQYYVSRARVRKMLGSAGDGTKLDIITAALLDPENPEILSILTQNFQGKTVKEILSSKMADLARKKIEHLVVAQSPVSFKPIRPISEPLPERMVKEEVDERVASADEATHDQIQRTPQATPPQSKIVLTDKLAAKLIRDKIDIQNRLTTAYNQRKSLRPPPGPRIQPLPPADDLPIAQKIIGQDGNVTFLMQPPDAKKTTGWRKFHDLYGTSSAALGSGGSMK